MDHLNLLTAKLWEVYLLSHNRLAPLDDYRLTPQDVAEMLDLRDFAASILAEIKEAMAPSGPRQGE
jgi:hypothetical protein